MPFEISFATLWTHGEDQDRAPLTALSDDNTHVHGRLSVVIAGRELPYLGYFGPEDVCFNAWVVELMTAASSLTLWDPVSHVFDEGEQGQPAFHFERHGSDVFVSIRASLLSGQSGDPEWDRVPCTLDEFTAGVSRFVSEFREALAAQAGNELAGSWWKAVAEGPA